MATSNKIFVSPGVYTSERDLSFVSQSVGITTLGMVGETLKGPAFEPIFITNYDEFQTYFGGTTPEKFVNTQIPKYESAYIAKSYLQQSNQLFVTRVLGLSGYDAGPSWTITTVANVDPSTIGFNANITTVLMNFTGTTASTSSIQFTNIPAILSGNFSTQYTKFNGATSTIQSDLRTQVLSILQTPSKSANTITYFGTISGLTYTQLNNTYTASTNVFGVDNVSSTSANYNSGTNDAWFYSNFNPTTGENYSGYSFFNYVNSLTNQGGGQFSGNCYVGIFTFSGLTFSGYNNMVLATLRSRGLTQYTTTLSGPQYQVTGTSDVTLVTSGAYSASTKNPYSTFLVSGITKDSKTFTFETSFNSSDSNYVSSVFGTENFTKERTEVPLFLEERYQTLLNYGYNKGYIRGISANLTALGEARDPLNTDSVGFYLERYQTPESPWVVSELRGSKVYKLFKVFTISDGNAANKEIKISVINISFTNQTFDLVVRDFYDTDANPTVLEKFTNCTMDPDQNSYIAKKIGTSDGEYSVQSKYILVEVNTEAPVDALPCGFEGFVTRQYSTDKSPFPIFKTKYDIPGEVLYNPPFGAASGSDDPRLSPGDNVRRTFLGISTADGYGFDADFFEYKGKQKPLDLCVEGTYSNWATLTKGFHMDSGATIVKISDNFTTSGESAFYVGDASFSSEPTETDSPYYRLFSRKFTFLVQGGFDGWDVYNERRTNSDRFALGQSGFKAGFCAQDPYPSSTGWGAFKIISYGDGTVDFANTDYYAYLQGILTFDNPEVTNINVFVTPGIDYVNNSNLVESTVDMIENDRADSIYIVTTPDFNLLQTSTSMDNLIYPQEAVDSLENTGIDSNYTATYYPWVLTRDTVNNTQVYLPATGEVCRNLALTDNIAFPWFATAGYSRGLVNSIRARKRLTQEDRDTLYKGRINPIATFNDVGTVIWGNKTLQIAQSALDRINVRRLLLQARKLISAVSVRLLFEQNDNLVRQQFLDAVNPILDSIRRDRGLYDFRVTVQNTPEDLDANQLVGKIYIKPTKSLEFIDIEFLITPSGASFENI